MEFALLLLQVVLVALNLGTLCNAEIIGAAIIPHGDLAWDPSMNNFQNGSLEIFLASQQVGQFLGNLDPDLIFLPTPHGVTSFENDFAIWLNSEMSGYAEIGRFMHDPDNFPIRKVYVNVTSDQGVAEDLTSYLRNTPAGENVTGVVAEPDSIRWAEAIPLLFLQNTVLDSSRFVFLAHPSRRELPQHTPAMYGELTALGHQIFSYFHSRPERVVYLATVDLAHTHTAEPNGYSPLAGPFDDMCGEWIKTMNRNLLYTTGDIAIEVQGDEGWIGLAMLQGFLDQAPWRWQSELLANYFPTYYGMPVGTFLPL